MNKSKRFSGLLGFIESYVTNNAIIYYFIRKLVIHLNLFEEDFNILNKYFNNKKINIIDIGASDGVATNFFLKNLNVNYIYCYEPSKIFFKQLLKLKKKNNRIILKNYGLSYKTQKYKIYYPTLTILGFNLKLISYSFYNVNELKSQIKLDFANYKKIKIKSTFLKLYKYVTLSKKIDLVKIDVNGLEFEIIKAIEKQINRDKPLLVIENNSKLNEIYVLLKKYGYEKYFNYEKKFHKHKNQKKLDIFFIHKDKFTNILN